MIARRGLLAIALAALAARPGVAAERWFLLGSTTTTENSGLLNHLKPIFEAATGVSIRVVVAGSGKILRLAEAGDVDIALTHFPEAERAFVAAGKGAYRREAMTNDFLLIGPDPDPAGVRGAVDAADAFARIAAGQALFFSRGDESGTHAKEREIWAAAGVDPDWPGYRETGAGMGATLNVAIASGGYALVDRGTWAAFGAKAGAAAIFEGDPGLANVYSLILPTPERNPHLRRAEAEIFANWLTSDEGRGAIAAFRVDGEPVFLPPPRIAADAEK